jgi:hypothetical protein
MMEGSPQKKTDRFMNTLTFTFHTMTLEVQTHNPQLSDWLKGLYQSCDQSELLGVKKSRYVMQLEATNTTESLPIEPFYDGTGEVTCVNGHCYYHQGRFYTRRSEEDRFLEMDYNLETHTLRVNLGGTFLTSDGEFVYGFFRQNLWNFILPFHRLRTLHGAVVTQGDRTLFFSGDKGAGKTTAALQFVQDGYQLISDDSPLFTLVNQKACAFSSLDDIRISETTLNLFPQYRPILKPMMAVVNKYAIDRRKLPEGFLDMGPAAVTDLVILRRGDYSEPRLFPVEKKPFLDAFIRDYVVVFRGPEFSPSPYPFQETSLFTLDLITTLFQQSNLYIMEFSDSHLSDLPHLVKETLFTAPA